MRRIPPYIDCILQYYLMETFGQVACTARTLPIRFTVGTGGTISYCLVRSILERTDTIAVVGQVAQFNLTTKP